MGAAMESPLLEVRNLHRYLGAGEDRPHVLRGLDLTLGHGQTYAVVGPSGCGKSTLLYLLGLLDRPDEGSIHLRGERVDNANEEERTRLRGRRLGFVFQFHFLLAEFTAVENLMLPISRSLGLEKGAARERALELLNLVGLSNKADRLGNQLSGGERQRVAVARALANDPDLILADEPTGNLDHENSAKLFDQLQHLAHDLKRTILVVTHNQDLAHSCDHVLAMRDGRFVASS